MKNIFCTNCKEITPHKGEVDQNGELLFLCQTKGCEAFVKFPQVENAEELEQLISDREEINRPIAEARASHDKQNEILSQILEDGTQVTANESEE